MSDNESKKCSGFWIELGSVPSPIWCWMKVFDDDDRIRIILLWFDSWEFLEDVWSEKLHKWNIKMEIKKTSQSRNGRSKYVSIV
jgi:hypothetical protein